MARLIAGLWVIGLIVVGLGLTFLAAVYGLRASLHRAENAPYRWLVAANRWQAAWFPDQLNEIGLLHRSQAFRLLRLALACWGAMLIPMAFLLIAQ